jgi:hypothetical protein
MKRTFHLIAAILAFVSGCASQPNVTSEQIQQRHTQLDAWLSQQNFSALFQAVEPNKFGSKAFFTPTPYYNSDGDWINEKTNMGHVPIMYLAAYRLARNGQPDAALGIYAQARVRGFLDAKSCKSDPRFPWYNVLETSFPELQQLRSKSPLAYARFANDALARDVTNRSSTSPAWYCESVLKNNILPQTEAYEARDKQIQAMLKENNKLLSQHNQN